MRACVAFIRFELCIMWYTLLCLYTCLNQYNIIFLDPQRPNTRHNENSKP